MAQSRSGPGWPVFIVVVAVLIAVAAAGFAALHRQLGEVTQSAEQLQEQLTAAQRAQDDSALQVADQGKQLSTARKDIESLIGAVSQLGETVESQAQNTIDPGQVLAKVSDSVVTVTCGATQGTGFAIDVGDVPDGYQSAVLTNHHVVADCAEGGTEQVAVQQGDTKPAALLSQYDDVNDLALVFVDKQLQPLAAAQAPAVGDGVVAIGSPYGISDTTTSGTITNIQEGFYTTDAAIGPGNSGGPLVNRNGEAIGVITAKLEGSEGQNIVVKMSVTCQRLLDCP